MERDNKYSDDSKQNAVVERRGKPQKQKTSASQKITIGILSGILAGTLLMWLLYVGVGNSMMVNKADYDKYLKAGNISDYVDQNYYVDVDTNNLTEGMYKGLLEGLNDPYSSYMTKEEYKKFNEDVTGEFCGIGVTITINDKKLIEVVSVMDESPAQKAGIKTGDFITKIDNKEYSTLEDAANAMRGKQGSEVNVTFIADDQEKTVKIKRDEIKVETVTSAINDENIGYIRISQFAEHTGDDFIKAIDDLEAKKAKGCIIDLRNNGGGLVDECLKVADKLLGDSVIVCYVDNKGEKSYSRSDAAKTKLKYVLLVDGGTASASEIVTAAVKENKGGQIVGQKTFGKGVIQNTTVLEDGSAIKLTVMQYLSPEGNAIHKKGVNPDIVVVNAEGKDEQLLKAQNILAGREDEEKKDKEKEKTEETNNAQ